MNRNQKKGFTLLEVIIVIVILGIVSSIGSSVIAQVYESYIVQRSVHNASIKTELAINQLTNRLTFRMNRSLLARVPGQTGLAPAQATSLSGITLANAQTHTALEWIGYENDGFSAQYPPKWSGFCDLNSSNFTRIVTRGSRLTSTSATNPSEQEILNNLSRSSTAPDPAIQFMGPSSYRTGFTYNTICMYQSGASGCMFPVSLTNNNTLTFNASGNIGDRINGQMIYSEFYQLAASAYAVVPIRDTSAGPMGANGGSMIARDAANPGVEVWDLYLFADYQPWNGQNYTNGSRSLLAKNVSVFRFREEVGSIRVKICSVEQISQTDMISICKEKAVIR